MKLIIIIKVNIFVIMLLWSILFAQNVYYVAPNGNNSNPGTFEQPWKTIQYAVDQVQAGDNVNIKAGTYNEEITIKASGTEKNPIVIKNYENDIVKVDANNKSFVIIIEGCHYLIIEGLIIFGANGPHNESCNIHIRNKPSHVTIQGCDIYDSKYGILNSKLWTDHEPTYISIIGNQIHDNGQQGIRIFGTKTSACNNILISGNNIYDNGYDKSDKDSEWGVGIYTKCDYSIIEDNHIHQNNGEGIFMDAFEDRHYHHNIVRRNQIYGNGYNGIMFAGQDYSLVHDNKIHDNGLYFLTHPYTKAVHGIYTLLNDYNIFYNNEIYNHAFGSAIRPEGQYNVIRDNVFYNNGYGFGHTNCYGPCYAHVVRNNLIYNGAAANNSINWPAGSGAESDGNKEMHFFHNVFFDNEGYGVAFVPGHNSVQSTEVKLKNNIFMNSGLEHIWIADAEGFEEDYNNIYPDRADAVKYENNVYNLFNYKSATGQGTHSISQNPLFADSNNNDFHLTANSPCIDTGGFLTYTRNSGSGNRIPLQDVMYFCDGHGIIQGDLIQLEGQTQTARITVLDYDNNILTIDGYLTWTKGQGVGLHYRGSAPDIGVFEYTTATNLSASITLSDPSPTKVGNVIITLTINKPVIKVPTPLFFMESDGTISTIDLSGDIPGNTFTGIFVVDSTVSNGKGHFFLSEGILEDENGNMSNLIIPNIKIIIDQIVPGKPKNIEATVIK